MSQQQKTAELIKDITSKIEVEKNLVYGYQQVKLKSNNAEVLQKCNTKIIESQSIIDYYQESLDKLIKQTQQLNIRGGSLQSNDSRDNNNNNNNDNNTLQYHQTSSPVSYSRFDLIKYDCPSLSHKIQHMLQQLEFKLQVENQYKEANQKMSQLYLMDGDKSSSIAAEGGRTESNQRIQLLEKSLKKYTNININTEEFSRDFELLNTPKHARKPSRGRLTISITCVRDVDHIASTMLKKRETCIVIKIDDIEKGKTKLSKNDKWNDEFIIDVEKGHEIEFSVLDKQGTNFIPVALNWLLISDIAEEIRKKKVANDMNSGWMTASHMQQQQQQADDKRSNTTGSPMGAKFSSTQPLPPHNDATLPPPPPPPSSSTSGQESNGNDQKVQINTWISLEPSGQMLLSLNFEKDSSQNRQFRGALGRHGAIREKKEEVFEQQGHQFVQKQFYGIMCCALCGEFVRYSGFQCQDCKFLCHKKCYQKVVTKCISKSGMADDEAKLKHRIPHRFEAVANHGAKWCCHCGYILPFGKKNVRKCTECGVMCHTQCTHLVPDFCGMTMQMANQILSTIKSTKVSPKKPLQISRPSYTPGSTTTQFSKPEISPLSQTFPPPRPSGEHSISDDEHEDDLKLPTHTQNKFQYPVEFPEQQFANKPRPAPAPPGESDLSFDTSYIKEQQDFDFGKQPYPAYESRKPLFQPIDEDVRMGEDQQQQQPQIDKRTPQGGAFDAFDYQNVHTQDQIMSEKDEGNGVNPFRDQVDHAMRIEAQQQQQQHVQQQHAHHHHDHAHHHPRQKDGSRKVRKRRKKVGLDDFEFLAVLGKGNFGKVMLAESRYTKKLCAIKVLKKDFIVENDEAESVKSEKRVFLTANKEKHPFLLNLHCCFQTENRIYFVMEYISGGDLMWHIQKSRFTAKRAKFYACEVLLALKYFHENGIVYRDLKLDNILLTTKGHIKIADYGLCKENMWHRSTTSTFCGTPEFMAPEIVAGKPYDRSVDWWAFGVLLFQMLLCQSPFKGDDEDDIFNAIEHDEVKYPISLSRQTVLVLQALLTKDPLKRLGGGPRDAEEIMEHPYFHDVNFDDVFHCRIEPPYYPEITSEHDYSNFDQEFTSETPRLTPVETELTAEMQEQFRGFSHISEDAVIYEDRVM